MKYLTIQQIKAANPCRFEYVKARRFFGKRKRVAVSVKAAVAVAQLFDWSWLARHFLTAPACKTYTKAMATAYKAHNEATATAYKAYDEAIAAAFARAYLSQ